MGQEEVQASTEEQAEVPPPEPSKPKKPKMVNVYNAHHFRVFHWGKGNTLKPGISGKIPLAIYDSIKDRCNWIKRAERGDVI